MPRVQLAEAGVLEAAGEVEMGTDTAGKTDRGDYMNREVWMMHIIIIITLLYTELEKVDTYLHWSCVQNDYEILINK